MSGTHRDDLPDRDRRAVVAYVSALLGGALVGAPELLRALASGASASSAADAATLPADDVALLDAIADTILPETDTPGASAAGVGPFVALSVAVVYSPDKRETFLDGFAGFRERCRETHGRPFDALDPAERLELVTALDAEQHAYMDEKDDDAPTHWFRMMKELTLLGFFTSEIGYTQVMRYEETPGRFDPCVPLEPGGKSWARHA